MACRPLNEPGCRVRADAYLAEIAGVLTPQAEIAAHVWAPLNGPFPIKVAPPSRNPVLPAAAARNRDPAESVAGQAVSGARGKARMQRITPAESRPCVSCPPSC